MRNPLRTNRAADVKTGPRTSGIARLWIAMLAVATLLAQALAPAVAQAAPRLDAFGGVICTVEGAKSASDVQGHHDPAQGSSCCHDCIGFAAVTLAEPPIGALPVRYARVLAPASRATAPPEPRAQGPPRPPGQGPPAFPNA